MRRRLGAIHILVSLLMPALAHGQIVLRWGGVSTPATEQVDGVRAVQLPWSTATADSGGQAFQLRMDRSIGALGLDPIVDLAPAGQAWDNRHVVFDGDPSTVWADDGYTCAGIRNGCNDIYAGPGTNEVDLGSRYLIERIVVTSGFDNPAGVVRDFRVHLSGELPKGLWCCGPLSPVVAEVRDNRDQAREVVLESLQRARFVQVAVGEQEEGWQLHDIQVFGRGFVEEAAYVSNIIDFGRPVAWGQLRWAGSEGEDARVLIQTRSGTDSDPQVYWRYTGLADQKEAVSREAYEALSLGQRAGTGHDLDNWSFWSAPYAFDDSTGTRVLSPGPRRYLQFRVDFLPGEDSGGHLEFLQLSASTPAATQLLGEVWPVESASGQWQDYTYFVFPSIGDTDTGFDRIEIASLSRLGSVLDVRQGGESVAWDVLEADTHRFVVGLPMLRPEDSGAIIELRFEAQVLRYGSRFDAQVWDSGQRLLAPQQVDPGDATARFEGDRVVVTTPVRSRDLLQLTVAPAVVTPNGDGKNERSIIAYDILDITGDVTVRIDVLDLSGRRVRQLHDGAESIGHYERAWDGRDDSGGLVPPGLYIGRLSLRTDERHVERLRAIHVVY